MALNNKVVMLLITLQLFVTYSLSDDQILEAKIGHLIENFEGRIDNGISSKISELEGNLDSLDYGLDFSSKDRLRHPHTSAFKCGN